MKTIMRGQMWDKLNPDGTPELDKKGQKIREGGTLVFHFEDGHAAGLDLYREWTGPELKPGVEVPA